VACKCFSLFAWLHSVLEPDFKNGIGLVVPLVVFAMMDLSGACQLMLSYSWQQVGSVSGQGKKQRFLLAETSCIPVPSPQAQALLFKVLKTETKTLHEQKSLFMQNYEGSF